MYTFNEMIQFIFKTNINTLHLNTEWYGEDSPIWCLNDESSIIDHNFFIIDHDKNLTKEQALDEFVKFFYKKVNELYLEATDYSWQITSHQYANNFCY